MKLVPVAPGNNKGFTLIELLIASTIFSIILLAAGSALVQVSRMYYKGVITSRTQGTARTTMDNVARSVQFGGGPITAATQVSKNNPTIYVQCVGNTRFTFAVNAQVYDGVPDGEYEAATNRIQHGLWQDTVASGDCGSNVPDLKSKNLPEQSEGRELLGQYMRLTNFDIQEQLSEGKPTGLWNIAIGVAYGDNEVLIFADPVNKVGAQSCSGIIVGAQWCSVSKLTTGVYKRVE